MGDTVIVQSGGKLIGEGGYGCIFNPPLLCNKAKAKVGDKRRLGKLTEIIDLRGEITAAKFLGKNPDASKYCILPMLDTLCKPAEAEAQKEEDVASCKVVKDHGMKDMMQYQLEYGGKTLKYRILGAAASLDDFPFFDFMGRLLEVGAFIALNGFIHNDLHGNNIVFKEDNKPRLIDFGRSYVYNMLDSKLVDELSGVYYAPDLPVTPPEITAHHGVLQGVPFDTIVADLFSKKPPLLHAERVLGISRTDQLRGFRDFWMTSRSIQAKNWVDFYKLYWPAVDSWAIGVDILSILRRLLVTKKFSESKEWQQKQGLVKGVLRKMLQASPKKRIDAVQALALYDPTNEMVASRAGRNWLDKAEAK